MLPQRDGVREVQAELDDYLARLERRLALNSVVVTGSRARNEHMRRSDIDLVVVSGGFEGLSRGARIELLLEEWTGLHALEPLGFTAAEIERAHGLYLWDALADGRVVRDDGTWGRAVTIFRTRCEKGELTRCGRGWRVGGCMEGPGALEHPGEVLFEFPRDGG